MKSDKIELEEFDKLIQHNKKKGKAWYYGLPGKWWWGMNEEKVRKILESGRDNIESGNHNVTKGIIKGPESCQGQEQNNKSPKIAIASIVRNEESNGSLDRFLDCCEKLEKDYNIFYIFIEGDSSDRTYEVLKGWLSQKNDYILKKIDRGHTKFPKNKSSKRTKYFAELRNMLIDFALSISDITEVLMIDANYGWKDDIIAKLRDTNADISAPLVVMNKVHEGKYLFYDIWAFRKDGQGFSSFYPYVYGLKSKPMKIDSAGGGYLIKRKVLESGIRYDGHKDCEHVGFCRGARKKGFSVKINPNVYIKKGGKV